MKTIYIALLHLQNYEDMEPVLIIENVLTFRQTI